MEHGNSASNTGDNSNHDEIEVIDSHESKIDTQVQKSLKFSGWLYRKMEEEMEAENVADFTAFTMLKINKAYRLEKEIAELRDLETEEVINLETELGKANGTIANLRAEILDSTANEELQTSQEENEKLRELLAEHTWLNPQDINQFLCEE